MYTDVYQKVSASLKAGGLAFYNLHVAILKFSGRGQRLQNLSGATISGYLPAAIYLNVNDITQSTSRPGVHQRMEA